MIEVLQAWLPDPAHPLSPLVAGLGAALAILVLGGALSVLRRGQADLVIEGAIPLRPFNFGDPRTYSGGRGFGLQVAGLPCAPPGSAPPGCVLTEVRVRMPYGRDFTRTMAAILEGCRACDDVLDQPAPRVRVVGLADSTIELLALAWSPNDDSAAALESLRRSIADHLADAVFEIPLADARDARVAMSVRS